MEGVYRKIYIRIWRDDEFRGLTEEGKLLFFYLLTCPHGHLSGIFVLPIGYAMEDLGWEPEEIRAPWIEIERNEMIRYDHRAKVLLLPNFLKYNPFENRNTVINAVRNVEQLPDTHLKREWCEAARMHLKGKQLEFVPPLINALEKTLPEPLPEPSGETEAGAGTEAGGKPSAPTPGNGAGSEPPIAWAKKITWNKDQGRFEGITPEIIADWKEAFPAVNLGVQLARADEWLKANPKKLKKNYYRFLVNWLGRSQERGGR